MWRNAACQCTSISCCSGTMDGYVIGARTDALLGSVPSWIDRDTCSVWECPKKTKPTAPSKVLTFKCDCKTSARASVKTDSDDPSEISDKFAKYIEKHHGLRLLLV